MHWEGRDPEQREKGSPMRQHCSGHNSTDTNPGSVSLTPSQPQITPASGSGRQRSVEKASLYHTVQRRNA